MAAEIAEMTELWLSGGLSDRAYRVWLASVACIPVELAA